MPIYPFIHNETKEVVDVYIPITGDVTSFNGFDGTQSGQWKRCYDASYYNTYTSRGVVGVKQNAHSQKDFLKATENKNYTIGDLWERSRELSEERKAKDGVDKVKEKFLKDYEKQHGVKHIEQVREDRKENLKKVINDTKIFKAED